MASVQSLGTLPAGHTRASLRTLVSLACRRAGARGKLAIAVRVTDDAAIRRLNRVHRGKDKVTDVLSFSYDAGMPAAVRRPGERDLGDIIISLPQVRRQAKAIGRSVKAEFGLMVVHGVLHLLGFDHETLAQETAMFALQRDILIRAGLL